MINLPGSTDPALASLALPTTQQEEQRTTLGQEDFLSLMITQFRNQDPFEPMNNGEFIAQMAQFSSVAGIAEMNESMESLATSLYANQAMQAAQIVGREVLADGDHGTLGAETPLQAAVDLPFATSSGYAQVFDNRGELIKEIPLGSRDAGPAQFEWDGILADGTRAEPGIYRIAGGVRSGAEETALPTFVGSRVTSISLAPDGRGAQIATENGQKIGFSQIKAIM